jgi:hypothetical protein
MPDWSIGYPDKERLEVLLSPEMPHGEGYEWLSADVKLDTGGFSGAVRMSMRFSELIQFQQELGELYRNLSGTAELKTLERQLHLLVKSDHTGHITVTGELFDRAGDGNKLCFTLRFDQTRLWHTVSELDEALFEIKEAHA